MKDIEDLQDDPFAHLKIPHPDFEDEADIEFLRAYETGELKPLIGKALEASLAAAKEAAEHYVAKRERMNIRISSWDKMMLQRKAAELGLGYQTLAASILHQYVTGHLKEAGRL